MSSETKTVHNHHEGSGQGLWAGGHSPFNAPYGKLMMWYFLLSDAFTFAGFLISYGALRFSMPTWPLPDFVFRTAPFCGNSVLPLVFVSFMTLVLIISSVTMVRAVQEGHRENKNGVVFWMLMTIIGGATFLGCQAWEWTNLITKENVSVFSNPYSRHVEGGTYLTAEEEKKYCMDMQMPYKAVVERSDAIGHHHGLEAAAGKSFKDEDSYMIAYDDASGEYLNRYYKTSTGDVKKEAMGPKSFGTLFFFITGFHGFHVLSGVVFLIIVLMNVTSGIYGSRHNHYETVEKMGLYWHFVDLVWVFVFLVFYLV